MNRVAMAGYTILEVMLFIAISAAMFVLAMTSFSGRQQDVQFNQAVRELDAKLQDIINDVATGFFPNAGQVDCSVTAADRPVISSGTPAGQGTNEDCVFIGKVVQFVPKVNDNQDDQSLLYTYNLIGRRNNTAGKPVESLSEAKPIAMAPETASDSVPDMTDKSTLQYGLRVTKVAVDTGGAGTDTGAIGFFTTFARSFGTSELSDAQNIRTGWIPGTNTDQTEYDVVDQISRITDDVADGGNVVDLSGAQGMIVCLQDTDSRRRASITIGGGGRASTKVDFDTYNTAVCGS